MFRCWLAVQKVVLLAATVHAGQIDVPVSMRQSNDQTGSCAHAALSIQLRVLGYPARAKQWWKTHSGGEDSRHLDGLMDQAGIKYRETDGDIRFIEDANAAGYLVQVEVLAGDCTHALLVNDIDSAHVRLIDVNNVKHDWQMSRSDFERYWTGWGFFIYGLQ